MRGWFCGALIILSAACDQGLMAQSQPASWVGSIGHLVVDGGNLESAQLEYREGDDAANGEMSIIPGEEAGIDRVLRLATLRQPAALDSLKASLTTKGDIEEGAPCWLHLMAKAVQPQVETGLARLSIGLRSTEVPARQVLEHEVYVEPSWTPIDIPFRAEDSFAAGEAKVVLGVGTQLQVIDIGKIMVRCFDLESTPGNLPKTLFTYAGRADDAPWRKISEGRIDRYRKGDLIVKVVDADNQPVPDAEIQMQMTRHAFKFGTTVDVELLAGAASDGKPSQYSGEDTTRYRKTLQQLFNIVTFENSLDWAVRSDTAERRVNEDALAWVNSLGLALRGSRLVSGSWSDLPADLQEKRDDPEAIRALVRERVGNTVGALDGRITEWDVLDWPHERRDAINLSGLGEIGEWFRVARAASAGPRLFLTESDVLAGDRLVQLVTMLSGLTERDVPIDAIGVKGHFNEQPPPIQVLSDRFDQLASFDLPIMITDFDMDTDDPALLADFTRDLMILAFSHPSVEGFMFQGFWQGQQAEAEAVLYRGDWTLQPVGEIYRDLVLGQWWTDDVALSNADGDLQTRGFLGDYVITARKDNLSATSTLSLGSDGASIVLRLDKATSG